MDDLLTLHEKDRSRNFMVLLYDETQEEKNKIREIIKDSCFCEFVYICHDKDKRDEELGGDLKKRHIHFIFSFNNAITVKSLSRRLGIETRFIQVLLDQKKALRYLIHKDDPTKYQYQEFEVLGTEKLLEKFHLACLSEDHIDEYAIYKILDYIEFEDDITQMKLVKFCADNCLLEVLKQYSAIINPIVREKNNRKYKE